MYKELKGKYLVIVLIVLVLIGGVIYILQQKNPSSESIQSEKDLGVEEFVEKFSAPPDAIVKYLYDEDFVKQFSAPVNAQLKYETEEFEKQFSAPSDTRFKYIK